MKTTILFIFLISTQIVCGQDSLIDSKFSLKFSPLSLIDPYGGSSYRFGAEFKLHNNIALYLEGGGFLQAESFLPNKNVKGFISKLEVKYYLNKEKLASGIFLSLEYMYKEQAYDCKDSIRLSIPKDYKEYRLSKYVNCINVKFGETKIKSKRLLIEKFAGIGIRIKNASSGLTKEQFNNIADSNESRGGLGEYYNKQVGHFTSLNITAGIKIGYSFK